MVEQTQNNESKNLEKNDFDTNSLKTNLADLFARGIDAYDSKDLDAEIQDLVDAENDDVSDIVRYLESNVLLSLDKITFSDIKNEKLTVFCLKVIMKKLWFYTDQIKDGAYDLGFRSAVRKFQQQYGLSVDWILGRISLWKIGDLINNFTTQEWFAKITPGEPTTPDVSIDESTENQPTIETKETDTGGNIDTFLATYENNISKLPYWVRDRVQSVWIPYLKNIKKQLTILEEKTVPSAFSWNYEKLVSYTKSLATKFMNVANYESKYVDGKLQDVFYSDIFLGTEKGIHSTEKEKETVKIFDLVFDSYMTESNPDGTENADTKHYKEDLLLPLLWFKTIEEYNIFAKGIDIKTFPSHSSLANKE